VNKLFGVHEGKKDCGKARREKTTVAGCCDKCAADGGRLTSQRVGNGPPTVHHQQFVDEDFRKERHVAARQALQKSERSSKTRGHKHVEVISSQNSVWCPEYYHHPKTVAETNHHRQDVPATTVARPPVDDASSKSRSKNHKPASHPAPSSRTSGKPTSEKPREGYLTKGWEAASSQNDGPGVLSVSAARAPAFEPSDHRPRRLRKASASGPRPEQDSINTGSAATHDYKSTLPMAGQREASTKSRGHADSSRAAVQLKPSPQPRAQPKPLYQIYLDAQYSVGEYPPPRRHVTRQKTPRPAKEEPKKTMLRNLGMAIGIDPPSPTGTSSDISFACGSARHIEGQANRQG
jgi:hypothetical protein